MKENLFIFTTIFLMTFPLVFRFTGEPDYAEKASYRFAVKPLAWGGFWAFLLLASAGGKEIAKLDWISLPEFILGGIAFHYVALFFIKAFGFFGASFKNSSADQHRRGHHMATAGEVVQQIKRNKEVSRFSLGGVPIPRRLEDRSLLFVGSPGSGKSQAICAVLDAIKLSTDRAVITDPSAQFLRRYKREDTLILNPLDARSVKWSPFAEFEDDSYKLDAVTIATSLVPPGNGASTEEWRSFVRSLIRDIMIRLWELDRATNGELNHFATIASMDELRELLAGTPSVANLLQEGADKLLGSVRMTGDAFLQPLSLLDPDAGKDSFSVRKWTHNGKGWLFLTYQQNRRAVLTPIIGAVLNVFADAMLTRQIAKDRAAGERVWGVFDEFPLLGKVSSIEKLLSNGSKHGFAGILGLQTIAQFRSTYGQEDAISIMACLRSWLVLRCTDAETSAFMAQHAGKEEILRINTSNGNSDGKKSENKSEQILAQDVLMPSEIQHWPDLQGVLNLAGAYPICPIVLQIVAEVADRCIDFEKTTQNRYQQPQPASSQPSGELARSSIEIEI